MKNISLSKNQIYFGLCTILLSSVFFRLLYKAIQNQAFQEIGYISAIYGVAMFINGLTFGYRDNSDLGGEFLGFRYHLITFIIVNTMGIPWLLISMDFSKEYLWVVFTQVGAWSIGLFLHWFIAHSRRRAE